MDLLLARQVFSPERMITYEIMSQRKDRDPVELYLLNIQISGAFYFPLHVCEVVLRNAADQALCHTHTNDWHMNKGFQISLIEESRNKLLKSISNKSNNGSVTKGDVIANLTLGFWVNLLAPKYNNMWTSTFYNCFKGYKTAIPTSKNPLNAQNKVFKKLTKVQKFRNRIAHYEPIINLNLANEYKRMMEIISYIDPKVAAWVETEQNVMNLIATLA